MSHNPAAQVGIHRVPAANCFSDEFHCMGIPSLEETRLEPRSSHFANRFQSLLL